MTRQVWLRAGRVIVTAFGRDQEELRPIAGQGLTELAKLIVARAPLVLRLSLVVASLSLAGCSSPVDGGAGVAQGAIGESEAVPKEIRFEGVKSPSETNPQLRGACTIAVTLDKDGEPSSIDARIRDPKKAFPEDDLGLDHERANVHSANWSVKRNKDGQLQSIKVTKDLSGTLFNEVIEVQDLDKQAVKLSVQRVFQKSALATVRKSNSCDGLERVASAPPVADAP